MEREREGRGSDRTALMWIWRPDDLREHSRLVLAVFLESWGGTGLEILLGRCTVRTAQSSPPYLRMQCKGCAAD